jgi:serine/threonine-protein kinase SRPK3
VFDGTWSASSPYMSEAHLAQMEAVLGKMPKSLLSRSNDQDRFFDSEGESTRAPHGLPGQFELTSMTTRPAPDAAHLPRHASRDNL